MRATAIKERSASERAERWNTVKSEKGLRIDSIAAHPPVSTPLTGVEAVWCFLDAWAAATSAAEDICTHTHTGGNIRSACQLSATIDRAHGIMMLFENVDRPFVCLPVVVVVVRTDDRRCACPCDARVS